MFLEFANFYQQFIQGFTRRAAPLTSLLKISGSTEFKTQLGKSGVGVGGSRGRRYESRLDRSRIDDDKVNGGEFEDDEIGKKVQKLSKSKNLSKSDFFILRAKLVFTKLRQAFVKAPILYHFDPKRHIRIETGTSDYAIGGVFG